jgi:hypothetical protein
VNIAWLRTGVLQDSRQQITRSRSLPNRAPPMVVRAMSWEKVGSGWRFPASRGVSVVGCTSTTGTRALTRRTLPLSRSRYRFAILRSLYYSFFLCSARLVVHTLSIPHPSKHPSFNPSTIYPTLTRPHSNVPRHQTPHSASRYFRELAGLRVTPDETDIPLRP